MKPIIAVPATAALVYRAWSRKSLTPLGIAVAAATAVAHAVHPWSVFFALLSVFFLSGTAVTKVKHDVKARLTHSSTGSPGGEGPRTHVQVLANSIVASVLILLHTWQTYTTERHTILQSDKTKCWPKGSDVLVIGIVANYAAVASDTFSSELGILSSHPPRLITAPWRIVPPGTNGGVTITGLGAGFLGSFIIAFTSTLLIPFCEPGSVQQLYDGQSWTMYDKVSYTAALTFAGFCGTLLDSLLGAVLQASVVDVHSGKVVEGEGGRKVLVHSAGSLHMKQRAKVRGQVVDYEEGKESVAKTSALEKSPELARRLQSADGAESVATGAVEGETHESRRVDTGRDILDNNAVNLLMALLVSIGAMLAACKIWNLPFSSIVS